MRKQLSFWIILLLSVLTVSCGGGGGNTITDPGSGTITNPGDGVTDPGTGDPGGGTNPDVFTTAIGSGFPPAFNPGQIAVGVANGELAAGGSTTLTVTLVATNQTTGDQTLLTSNADVTFSSACISQGLATITDGTMQTAVNGSLTVQYRATGCSGADVITATAVLNGQVFSATGSVSVAAASVGSIQFESVSPATIGLRGTGGLGFDETATVIFRVTDSSGGPVAGRDVAFDLNTAVGGVTLTPAMAVSGADGRVQTTVQSGSVATSVRVTATVTDISPMISSQSSELTITTGLPDQDSVTLSVECNNIEALTLDGTQNPVTVRLSDRFNNPVPDGTAVTLSTEGGSIAGQCATTTTSDESGICAVNWISKNPRPQGIPGPGGQAGRSSIYMTTIGEESFVDINGNGFFDDGDTFTDLDEPFLDNNENGSYDAGEPFFDFNNDQTYTTGDGLFSGLLCGGPDGSLDTQGRCATNRTIGISASNLIIMSGSNAVITPDTNVLNGTGTVTYWVRDANNQPLPAGTTISATTDNGRIVGPSSYTVPCMTSDAQASNSYPFSVQIESPAAAPATGQLRIEVEVPSGVQTFDNSVTVND